MITEKELNVVGKDSYIALLRLIKAFLLESGNKSPTLLLIPRAQITAIVGSKFDESINLLINNFVTEKFVFRFTEDSNPEYTPVYQDVNYEGHIMGTAPTPEDKYWDATIQCIMSAEELDEHIAETRKLGSVTPTVNIMSDEQLTDITPPRFNAEISRLTFRGKHIKISTKEDSAANKLLRALLKLGNPQVNSGDLRGKWNYDEIWGDGEFGEGAYNPKKNKMSIYHAARDVNEKVHMATGVKNFLDATTTTYILVNPVDIP